MTPDEIKKMWSDNGAEASAAGTKMHYDIECFYNDMDVEVEVDSTPDLNTLEVTVLFDIVGEEFPTQSFTFLLEPTR